MLLRPDQRTACSRSTGTLLTRSPIRGKNTILTSDGGKAIGQGDTEMQFKYIGIKICSYRLSRGSRLLESLRMRHARLWMYLFMTLSLGACAGIPDTKAPGGASLVPEYPTLVIIGDSLMFGSFDGPGTTTAAVLSHYYNWHVINISQSGQMVTAAVNLEIWKAVEFVAGPTSPNPYAPLWPWSATLKSQEARDIP